MDHISGSAVDEMPALDESPIDQSPADESPIDGADEADATPAAEEQAADEAAVVEESEEVTEDVGATPINENQKTDDEKLAPAPVGIVSDEMVHHQGGCATEIIEAGEELRPEVPLTEVTSGLVFEENLTTATEGGSEVVLENIATPYLDDVLQKNPECIDEQEIYNIVNEGKGSPGIVQVKITNSNL